jgi:hypothetical protein
MKQNLTPTREGHWARFYEHYRRVVEEDDKKFLEKNDEDFNMTLIFVSATQSRRTDVNYETAALLRVFCKIDNTTFGINVPTLPKWAGPPRTMVQV